MHVGEAREECAEDQREDEDNRVEREEGQAVSVASVASMDTGPIGEGVFLAADGRHGLGNYDL